ncbi:MAG: hypothetical protein LBR07_00225 [Puniceicoccales bacterium]|jgi:hypothetical protein|nr:hypothetical protein [Puniceicoccales bacterium]
MAKAKNNRPRPHGAKKPKTWGPHVFSRQEVQEFQAAEKSSGRYRPGDADPGTANKAVLTARRLCQAAARDGVNVAKACRREGLGNFSLSSL